MVIKMKIYLDLIMILNFFIDLLLLLVVNKLLRRNASIYALIGGAFVGGISSVFLFFKVSNLLLIIYKIVICFVMILISFKYKSLIYTFKNFLYFYISSIVLGGFLYFIDLETAYTNMKLNYIVLVIASPLILYLFIKQGLWLKTNYSNYFKVVIYSKNKSYNLNGFLDTGNKLTDIITNKPVILVDEKIDYERFYYIPYQGVNSNGLLKCIKVDKMIVANKIYKNVIIGLLEHKIKIDGINCLLNSKLKEDIC